MPLEDRVVGGRIHFIDPPVVGLPALEQGGRCVRSRRLALAGQKARRRGPAGVVDVRQGLAQVHIVRGGEFPGDPTEGRVLRHIDGPVGGVRIGRQLGRSRHDGLDLLRRQTVVVELDIVDRAHPVTAPAVRADEDRGGAAGNGAHGGRIGLLAIEIAFQRRAVMRAGDMAPLVARQVLVDVGPGPGRRIERKRHVGLGAAPAVANLPAPTDTCRAQRLGHRCRVGGLSLRVIGARSYPHGNGDRTPHIQAGAAGAGDVVPAAAGDAQAVELQGGPQDTGDPRGFVGHQSRRCPCRRNRRPWCRCLRPASSARRARPGPSRPWPAPAGDKIDRQASYSYSSSLHQRVMSYAPAARRPLATGEGSGREWLPCQG